MYMAAAAMPPPPPPPFPPPSTNPLARYYTMPFPPSTALTTSLSTPQSPVTIASLSHHDLAEGLHRMSLGNGHASGLTANGNGAAVRVSSSSDLKSEGSHHETNGADKVKVHEKRDSVQRSGSDSIALPSSMGNPGVIGQGTRAVAGGAGDL
ncbi:uncharacterized protein BKA78DRAFT_321794 [Phyllosticta capitalensis]|uniref:uncharacterized protein n=1 Tax=Phyllosticta capitalensis TaxID=121624 RepID=UPI00312F2191